MTVIMLPEPRPSPAAPPGPGPDLIGGAPAMREVFHAIGRLARAHATVLINGESGTGKELVARALHRSSPRSERPFIALNMAAIPQGLLESEMFGHERGAFTGADGRRTGRFEQADGGTLFLDEIGDMPVDMQSRLLRVLADGEFYPVGARLPRKVDVRIVAATHQDLEALIAQGRFREDLFHRLNVIRLRLPSLRERREDIPTLLRHYLGIAAAELGEEAKRLTPEAETLLQRHPWPGNVRQLENACRWIALMVPGGEVRPHDLPPEWLSPAGGPDSLDQAWQEAFRRWVEASLDTDRERVAKEAIEAAERIMIAVALRHTQGHRRKAAERLGYGRNTLTRKIDGMDTETG